MIKEVTFENFEEIVDTHPLVILEFWTQNCSACKTFDPVFATLAEVNPDVCFGKVNAAIAGDLAQAFQIKSVPTIMGFKNAELVFEHTGLVPPEAFDSLFQQLRG